MSFSSISIIFLTLFACASAFAPPIVTSSLFKQQTLSTSTLFAKDDQSFTEDQLKRWREIRDLTDEEAEATLEGAELDGYKAHNQRVKDDIEHAIELTKLIISSMDMKEAKPKTKGQRKRDKWALTQARAAAALAAQQ